MMCVDHMILAAVDEGMMPIGYPDETTVARARKPVGELVTII